MKVSREDELTTLDERSFHSSTVTRCQGLGSAECQDAQLVGILLGSQVWLCFLFRSRCMTLFREFSPSQFTNEAYKWFMLLLIAVQNCPGGENETLGMGLCSLPLPPPPHPPTSSWPGVLVRSVRASTSVELKQKLTCLSQCMMRVFTLTCLIQCRHATEMCQGKFT